MQIQDMLDRARRLHGSREAVVEGPLRLSYAEVAERVARLAGALAASGLEPGARCGIVMLNSHRYLEAYFAVELAGGVAVPINHRLVPPEVAFILNDAEATHLIVDGRHQAVWQAVRADVPSLRTTVVAGDGSPAPDGALDYETALRQAEPLTGPRRDWREDDLLQLYYTSGTTGRPKGVMLTQGNVVANARHAIMTLHFDERDTWIHATPMFHLADAWACWTVAWVGGRHVFLPEFTPAGYLAAVERERVTASLLVPTMINAIVNAPELGRHDLGSLRLLAFGASPMPVDRLRAAMDALPRARLMQLYGMTETAPFATGIAYDRDLLDGSETAQRRLGSCGREILGVRARVVRDDGSDIAPGEVGEIVMRGPNVMAGYWRRPDATAETLRDGWLHSGDMATVDDEGYISIVDRRKDMIITGGENVYSTEVENALYEHPAVLEAAVIGIPDPYWGERVHAVIVARPGQSATADEIGAFCRTLIAAYKIPRSVEFVDALPKTGSGKIQKAELRDRYWQEYEARTGRRV
jgi:acyl-CoA synthetase (AMP-forming)/AMP-acid ligase II